MAKILGYWNCDYCGNNKIPSNIRTCPSCGRPVGEKTKYYIDTSNKVYVKENEVPKGPDWRCNYCASYNRFEAEKCKNCGALKEADSQSYFSIHEKSRTSDSVSNIAENNLSNPKAETETIYTSDYFYTTNLTNTSYDDPVNNVDHDNYEVKTSGYNYKFNYFNAKSIKMIGIVLVSILAIIGIALFLIPKEKEIIVNSFEWERVMYIEKYKTVSDSDWSIPKNARLKYTKEEIKGYNDVFVGYEEKQYVDTELDYIKENVTYEDLGNGYFEEIIETEKVYKDVVKTTMVEKYEKEPIYALKYYYDIDKFVYDHSLITRGCDKNPYWDEEPKKNDIPKIGDERVSSRTEMYMIYGTITNENESQKYTLDYSSWKDLNEGDKIKCKVYITGKIEIIEE